MSGNRPFIPFWRPWGVGGCLWRSLVFLLGILLISLLFGAVNRCARDTDNIFPPIGGDDGRIGADSTEIRRPWGDDPEKNPWLRDLPEELRDTTAVREWNDTIGGVDELPPPDRNFIPPVDSSRIITDPRDSTARIIGDQLIVLFNSTDLASDMAEFARRFKKLYPSPSHRVVYYQPAIGTMMLVVPDSEREQVADRLCREITDIDFIVTNNEVIGLGAAAAPSDPDFRKPSYDEYFKLIQAYDAWDVTRGDSSVVVAVVDSYFDLSNPEIGTRVVKPFSVPSKTRYVLPPARDPRNMDELLTFSHGSHVAGMAIGAQENGIGVSGIAPGALWMPVSLGSQLTTFNLIEGILYAINNGADVVNVSVGRSFPEEVSEIPLADQVAIIEEADPRGEALWNYISKVAEKHNCTIVRAAGNENIIMGLDPKNRAKGVIKVEAVDGKGIATDFTNFGKVPEASLDYSTVAAPGKDVWSVAPRHVLPYWAKMGYEVDTENGLMEMQGTSMASPVVAGAVALLKSKNPSLTNEEIERVLVATARPTDTEHRIGPTIQLRDALDAVGGETMDFDKVMADHNELVGVWKSTYTLKLTSADTNEHLDDMWTYFTFPDPDNGTLRYETLRTKRIYTAPVDVQWGTKTITFRQLRDASDGNGNTINADEFVCRPDVDRTLIVSCRRNGVERFTFKLQKIN